LPKIGQKAPAAPKPPERFHYAPLDTPTAPECLGAHPQGYDRALCDKPDANGKTQRGKHPIGKWQADASNSPIKVSYWRKQGLNLAVACGPSGVVVLDEDAHGELERFCRDHTVEMPDTYRVRTGNGFHYYLAVPDGMQFSNHNPFKAEGYAIDVRGFGGYVVAAGSVHASGVIYEAEDDDAPVSVMPEWLVAYLSTPEPREVKDGAREAAEPYSGDGEWTAGTFYERAAVNGCIAELRALPRPWPGDGGGWEQGTFDQACNLLELANVPFFDLTVADAEALIREHAPTDEVWGAEQVETKIASAHHTVGTRMRRDLKIDVVAEAAARTAPDLSALEREVWAYFESQYSTQPNRRAVKAAIRLAFADRDRPTTATTPETRKRSLALVNLAEVEFEVTEWAWDEVIPLGILTGIAGWAGIGKSTLISWLVAGLTRGKFEGDLHGQPASVLIVAGEDDTSRQLAPRLDVAGADRSLVSVVQPTVEVLDGQRVDTVMQLSEDIAEIRRMLIETGAKMLILDPILSFVDGNPNSQADVRRALDPLAALARELNIAVVVVMHFKKGHGVAGEKVSGSHVWRDALRSLLVMAIDEESQYRVVTIDKSNYSNARGKSMLFEVTGAVVRGRDTKGNIRNQLVSKAEYVGDSPKSVQDILEAENAKRDGRRVVNEDTAEIIAWICEQDEPVNWSTIARQAGVDPNAKEGAAKQERTNLMRKLSRAVERGDISRVGKGLYSKPTGLRPLAGLGGEEGF
jgi:hypothetical protein